MNNITKFTILALFFALSNKGNAQTLKEPCTEDSVFYKRFIAHMDTFLVKNQGFYKIEELFLNKEQNCSCALLIYVKLFDFLINNKLDLEFSILKDPPITMSGVMSINNNDIEIRKQRDESIKKFRAYQIYLILKKAFEEEVMKKYEADKGLSLEQDVNNILRYGIYAYPSTLKGILLTKNADTLLAKYVKEKAMFWDED
jgi:hypothetical protein